MEMINSLNKMFIDGFYIGGLQMTEIDVVKVDHREQPYRATDFLKVIAMITMFIDHSGVLLYPSLRILRTIGRIAFPIYAYALVQGFIHTRNRKKYAFRLFCFALIAEIPYTFLNNDMIRESEHYNVMYLLLFGLGTLVIAEKVGQMFKEKCHLKASLLLVLLIAMVALPDFLTYHNPSLALSYGSYGIVMMLIFYWFNNQPIPIILGYLLISFLAPYETGVYYRVSYFSPEMSYWQALTSFDLIYDQITTFNDGLRTLEGYFFQARSILGLLCILIFSRVVVPIRVTKYIGYLFYPLHITLLLIIRILNGGPFQP
jgi:hypothetical protein